MKLAVSDKSMERIVKVATCYNLNIHQLTNEVLAAVDGDFICWVVDGMLAERERKRELVKQALVRIPAVIAKWKLRRGMT